MKFPFVRSLLATLLLAAGVAHAADDEAKVKKNLEAFINAPAVESVKKTPYGGLFEVVLKSGELLYTDGNVSFIIDGSIIDAKSRKNITQARMAQLMKIDFATLPLDQAIKQVRGNGKRQVAVFEDPNCPICRVFTKFVDQLDDVTVYRFMYPVIDPSSQSLARTAWCAADRAGAWDQVMGGRRLAGPQECDVSGLVEILQFGEKHRIQNTPTVFLGNGKRLVGATPPEQFMAELEASAKR